MVIFHFNIYFYVYSEDYYGDVDLKALRKIGYRRWLRDELMHNSSNWTKDITYDGSQIKMGIN